MFEKVLRRYGFVSDEELSQAKYDAKWLAAQLDRERVNRARDRDSWAADVQRMATQYERLLVEHQECGVTAADEAVLAAIRLAEVRDRSLVVVA